MDALSSAAHLASEDEEVQKVAIWTPDKDLAQCVRGTRVVQIDGRRKAIRDAAGIREGFGVYLPLIPDLLALVGDAADGFPGIPGIGATGRPAFEPLRSDRLLSAESSRQTARSRAALQESATLRTDAPLSTLPRHCTGAVRHQDSRHRRIGWKRRGYSSVAKRLRPDDDGLLALGPNFKTLSCDVTSWRDRKMIIGNSLYLLRLTTASCTMPGGNHCTQSTLPDAHCLWTAPCPRFDGSEEIESLSRTDKIAVAKQRIAVSEADSSCARFWNAKPGSLFAPRRKLNAIHMRAQDRNRSENRRGIRRSTAQGWQ